MSDITAVEPSGSVFPYPEDAVFTKKYDCRSLATLETALKNVPAYQTWRAFDPGPSHSINLRYAALPALTKQYMRECSPAAFVPACRRLEDGLAKGEVELVMTSGSTDDRVTNIWHQSWWDASERASFKLNNFAALVADGKHREAILTSPLCAGVQSDNADLPMAERMLGRFLYLNEKTDPILAGQYHLDRMIAELDAFEPVVLEANPSLLAHLARHIADRGKKVTQPKLITLTYECPSQIHYRQIRRAFNAPVASSYGSTETGYVFMECEAGRFHQNCDFSRVDFQPLKEEHGGPLIGIILVTTFRNPWNVMMRFDVGDLVRLDQKGICPCGRTEGLTVASIEGRINNVTFTPDGRCVTQGQVDRRLSEVTGVAEYQLRQTARNEYDLTIIKEKDAPYHVETEAVAALHAVYGDRARIAVHFVKALLLHSAPKYQLTKSHRAVNIHQLLDERYKARS